MKSKMQKRWRFFHATDFQSLMYPCFTFCRILGIFPYKINNSIFETSKLHYIFSIIIICALCVLNLLIYFYKINISAKIVNFENVTLCFEIISYNILTGFIAVVTLVLRSPRMRLLQTIMDISTKISPKSYQKLSKLIHSKDIFGFFCVTGYFLICICILEDIVFMIHVMYTTLLVFTVDMLYMNCVCMLKACFKEINNDLMHMQEFIINNESCNSTIFYYKQKNLFLIMNIKALEKQHLIISNTVQMLNVIFSLHLLATIVLTFSEIIFCLYFHTMQWHNGLSINLTGLDSVIILIFIIYYFIKVVLLVWACETGKNEAQEIRITIHDVLNSTRDERIKKELQLFSLQTLHCENTFSAKAVNVDAIFLATMTGTITTYMLILLQFLMISHSCDGKSAVNITDNVIP